jgi:hypothetical protein
MAKKRKIAGKDFEQVGPNMLYSEEGMGPEELLDFAKRSPRDIAKAMHDSAKQVVGAQSGRNLSVEDLTQILQRQGIGRKTPHLIDIILDGGLYNPEAAPPLGVLHQAKKFVFDASASEYIGALLMKAQPEVLSQHDWARPPFETTWVEMDHAAYWERGLEMANNTSLGDVDNLFGFLVHQGTVWLFTYAPGDFPKGRTCGCSPFQYQLHTPVSFEDEMAMAKRFGIPVKQYRQALLGGMVDKNTGEAVIPTEWWSTVAGEVVRSHRMFLNPILKGLMDGISAANRFAALAAGAGDLKLILTLLLMVTRPRRMLAIGEVGPKRMLYKGHNLVRRPHSVVTMRLAKEAALHHAVTHEFTSQHRQMHDVRGHWAETRHGVRCEAHSWEPIDLNHFYCLHCNAKRWWRKAHTRGELRLGDKTTDYMVKR